MKKTTKTKRRPQEADMLVTQLRPGDLIGGRRDLYLVTKVQQANTFPGWACSSAANVLVTLQSDSPYPGAFGWAVHDYWQRSWSTRKDRSRGGFLPLAVSNVALGLHRCDDTRNTSTAHGEALRYFVIRGQASWFPRHGDYEPSELVQQAAELQERQAAEATGGSFPPPLWSSRAAVARWHDDTA